jgi:FMN phosphatase YigB (HAD superfamily)/predicted ATP-grasp superfamily ATP-dependent carboligase
MTKALIVSGGGFQGLGLLEALQRIPGVRPIIADVHTDNITRYLCADYFTVPPLADAEAFTRSLLQLVRQQAVEVVFPATARELPLLAKLRGPLQSLRARVAVSAPELVDTLLDKVATASFLATHGLPSQQPVDPDSHDFSHALFGKPRFGWGGSGTSVARSLEDIQRHGVAVPATQMVWFPFIEGFEEYSADFAIAPSGRLSPIVLRKRVRTSGGFAVVSETVDDHELHETAAAAANAITVSGGCGIFNIQIIRPLRARAFVSDVNPRFGTSAVHGLATGINLAAFFLDEDAVKSLGTPARTVRYLRTVSVPKLAKVPKAVVFDLDDTLVDHKAWMAAKIEATYQSAARDWVSANSFRMRALQLIDEGERAHLIDRIVDFFGWPTQRRTALIEAYRAARIDNTPLYPDVEPVLSSLESAGFKLALLTDNPVVTQRSKIEAAPPLRMLSSITYARETGKEKPAAEAFASAAAAIGLPPHDLCMVGDNYFRDALGAIHSGYGCAFLLNRSGAFVQHHAAISDPVPTEGAPAPIYAIDSLIVLRESLLPAH